MTDGTPGNTSLLKTFSEGYSQGSDAFLASTANGSLTTLGNKVLFTGADAGASALWATDGTAGGTVKISSDGVAVSLSAGGSGFTPFGGKELFWNGTGLGASPWVTDGTAAGTVQLKQLSAQAHQGESYGFAVAGGRALFNAVSAGVHTLWVTDGTPRGTYDIGLSGVTNPKNFTTLGNKVIFQATDGMHGTELWISDGFFSGTTLLKDINTNNTFSFAPFGASSPVNLTAVSLACFAAGTRIATPAGKTAVEDLREGDQVVTASGKARPVLWIGRRHIRIAGHPNPEVVASVRIAPHAFGRDKPHTAVYLSQDHAVFANQVLIPIRYLVNGTTVTMTTPCDVTYYHVELPTHDVVLAEGLPVESYLDSGDRGNFANSDLPLRLFPDLSGGVLPAMVWEACGCAPLKIVGPEVEAVRARLQRRSRTLQRREAGAAQSSTRTIPS